MDVLSLAASLTTLADLPRLVTALGHTAECEPLPAAYWPRRVRAGFGPTARIGRIGDLGWIGIEAEAASRAAARAAAILHERGEPTLITVIRPGGGTVVVSVAFGGHPGLSLLSGDPVVETCLDRLARLDPGSRLATAALVADILGSEGLGIRFFQAFRKQWTLLTEAIGFLKSREDRETLALLQLNRVLFLYFVQSRGWLNGQPDFIRTQVDRCLGRKGHLHRQVLQPLFFGTLNRRSAERSAGARAFGRVPFLNGGLFEPHPLERHWAGTIPNPVWRDVFDQLFERFHFTATEGHTSAIAPDMLGRVFEGLMAPTDRSLSGTFYTPPNLVRDVIQSATVAWIVGRTGNAAGRVERDLANGSPGTTRFLAEITVLDPAAGSGAFLLGALDRFAEWRSGEGKPEARLRRLILQRNLFGVDLNPAAVRLTELRLWLSVIAAEPAGAPGRLSPLPNLDCLVRQGDSLADPLGMIGSLGLQGAPFALLLRRLRQEAIQSSGREKKAAARRLREAELRASRELQDLGLARIEEQIHTCLAAARSPDLFGRRMGLSPASAGELRRLRRCRARLRSAARRFKQDHAVPWFQYQSHFGDVFEQRGGFDLVVGNPPWVRAEQLAPRVREQLRERYRWWRTEGGRAGFRHQPDLSVAFLERATELAAPGGVVAMLVPAKLASAGYGSRARHALATGMALHRIADLTSHAVSAFRATVYPMSIVARKERPGPAATTRVLTGMSEFDLPQSQLALEGPWILRQPGGASLAEEISARSPTLADRLPIHLGIKTGANHVFLSPPAEVEPELVRVAIRGRDIRPGALGPGVRILWPCDHFGKPLATLPARALQYLLQHEAELRKRGDLGSGPWWRLFRTGPACAAHRVTWADLAPALRVVALTGRRAPFLPLNTCYLTNLPSAAAAHALAGWLRVPCIGKLARLGADPARGGFFRFNARAVGRVPFPESVLQDPALQQLGGAAPLPESPRRLDEMAADHLGLTGRIRSALLRLA